MPNTIKYNASTEANALRVGNFHIGVRDVSKGPTSITGFYNGINPPSSGYTIYQNKASQGPSIICPSDDAQLIIATNRIAGASYTTVAQCFTFFAGQSDKFVMFNPINTMVTDGLVACFTAGTLPSYPRTGTTWYDISVEDNDGTLTNSPTFNSKGWIDFDGVDDWCNIPNTNLVPSNVTSLTVGGLWKRNGDGSSYETILHQSSNTSIGNSAYWFGWTNDNIVCCTIGARNGVGWAAGKTNIPATVGKWFYTVASWNGSTVSVWVNGILKVTYNLSTYTNPGTVTRLGASGNASGYLANGSIANIHINPNKAFTTSEMLQNYYQGPIVTDDLVGAFDAGNLVSFENSTTTTYSLTGSLDGTLYNGVGFSNTANGSWIFDGVDDEIDFGNPSELSNTQVTVTFWYNPTTLMNSTHCGIINGRTPGGRFCLFWINGTTLSTQYRDDSGLSRAAGGVWTRSQAPTSISTVNKWYFIQITGDESTDEWRVGIDLNVSTTDFGSQYVDPDSNQWLLGRRAYGSYDHSKIANLQIYDRILSQSEITQNYNANVNLYN